jgi:hypothetical protein
LYQLASTHGARPEFGSEIDTAESLLLAVEPRDQLWVELDGARALEHLCRCSSIQFTVDVNPADAIGIINELWARKLHELDYASNNRRWQEYIKDARIGYRLDRYGGPNHFDDLADYARNLAVQPVLMHEGQPVNLAPEETPNLEVELFLRSVWWNYRLRRYRETLALEMRPFARRSDGNTRQIWNLIAPVFGL